jgi:hypothetical protein
MRAESTGTLVAEAEHLPDARPVPGEEAWRALLEAALARHEFVLTDYPVLAEDGPPGAPGVHAAPAPGRRGSGADRRAVHAGGGAGGAGVGL